MSDKHRRPRPALVELTVARIRMYVREPAALFWTFGFPLLLTLALGVAFRSRPPDPVYVAVEAGAPESQRLVDALARVPDLKVSLLEPVAAREALRTGKVAIVVEAATATAPRRYLFDPTRPESRLARAIVDDALQRADGRVDPTRIADATISEPGSRYIDFLVPGMIGMTLMSSGMWGVGYTLVEMRTRKLIKRFVATPMKRREFLVSFVLVRVLFLLLELPVLLAFGHWGFSVPIRGSLALITVAGVLGALAFGALGLLVAARASSTETATGLMNLVQLPMFMCSGVFFSTAHFPAAIQPIVKALPLTTLNDVLRALVNEGAPATAIALPFAILLAWTVGSTALALRWFRWT